MRKNRGFTLIELMMAMFILTMLAVMILKSYSSFAKMAHDSRAEKELSNISYRIEQFRLDNFTYKGFKKTEYRIPAGASATQKGSYAIKVVDPVASGQPKLNLSAASGAAWAIRAEPATADNYTYLINSFGVKCKNLNPDQVSYLNCGTELNGSLDW